FVMFMFAVWDALEPYPGTAQLFRMRETSMSYQQFNVDQVTVAATGFKGPEGVVVDRAGNVYGGGTDGVLRKLSPDGRVSEFARTGGRPAGIALDRQGNLFVCDVGKNA